MTVKAGGKVLHSWKISSGRRGYETPRGSFRPSWASRMWYSRQYDGAPMPYAVFFNQGIATHGTNAVGRLGRPASHGCIRLRTAHAKKFYKLVHRHGYKRTRIIVTGKAKQTRVAKRSRRRPSRQQIRPRRNYSEARVRVRRYSLDDYERRRAIAVRRYYRRQQYRYGQPRYRGSWY